MQQFIVYSGKLNSTCSFGLLFAQMDSYWFDPGSKLCVIFLCSF